MNEQAFTVLMSFAGVLIGALISAGGQLIVGRLNAKSTIKQATVLRKMDAYKNAIQYVMELCYIVSLRKINTAKAAEKDEANDGFFRSFYCELAMFVDEQAEEKYNQIRQKADNGEIKSKEAYEQLRKLFDLREMAQSLKH